ncbi:MAG: hypothetical protein KAI95_01200, partial [Bacteroidales bacterium]|nr:hypothetical protein [Bacteroidales bacterium]
MKTDKFNPVLRDYVLSLELEINNIPANRIKILESLGDYIHTSRDAENDAALVFICTHNSRRSQLGQVWAHTALQYYGIKNVQAYSGGTGATAFNPRAIAAVERAGFEVVVHGGTDENPQFKVTAGEELPANMMFSKKYDDPSNPVENFCAILVCSDADAACPVVPGAEERISLMYDDPKAFDDTDQ